MTEYIEREELLRQMQESKADKPSYGNWDIAHDCCIDIVENISNADVEDIIRCEQCVNLRLSADGYRFCVRWDIGGHQEAVVRPDDFCSYGEKAEHQIDAARYALEGFERMNVPLLLPVNQNVITAEAEEVQDKE